MESVLSMSIFIVLMGYFSNPFNTKMYILSFGGMNVNMIFKCIFTPDTIKEELVSAANEPVGNILILIFVSIVWFITMFMLGRCLASMDKININGE